MSEVKTIYDIYHEILNGERKRFPEQTWNQTDSKETLVKLARYIMLDLLKFNRDDVIGQVTLVFLQKYRICGAMRKNYASTAAFIQDCFPEWDIKPWELRVGVPKGYWNENIAIEATKWLIEEILDWDLETVQNEISNSYFYKNNLGGMLMTLKIGAIDAVVLTYPEYDWSYLKDRRGYKITPAQAIEIRKLHKEGVSQHELARWFECDVVSIFCCVHRKTFK
ncbi:DUF4046 domain-containing protein [Solibacillus sp. FSL K6-1523]|uniref:DUF4046 domain-containing protein n=1 Tax=Solibacillus sp. FSL K6-1523 TaxID=2921471 RepID=UPI0030F4CE48